MKNIRTALLAATALAASSAALADENLFGYLRGAETLPKGSAEFYQWFTPSSTAWASARRAC